MKQYLQIKKIALAVAFGFGSLVASAQAPVIQWDKAFGGSNDDELRTIVQTSDGGYILGGYSYSAISGDKSQINQGTVQTSDYWIVKLDVSGNKQWDKTFGGNANDVLFSLTQTSDGGFIIGGYSDSGISGDISQASKGLQDYWVLKLDSSGNKIWDKTIGGTGTESLSKLIQTSDGGFILGGYSNSGISGDKTQANIGFFDYWVVKLNSNGQVIWDKTFGGNFEDKLYSLDQTQDGGYILGGVSNSDISGDKTQARFGTAAMYDYWVLKLDANGNKARDKTYGGSLTDRLTTVQQTKDGGYLAGGTSNSGQNGTKTQGSKGTYDYWIVKFDAAGNILWDKTIGGNAHDELESFVQTNDNGFILGGYSNSIVSGDKTELTKGQNDYWLVKIDNNGNKLWDKTTGGNETDQLYGVSQTSDNGYILGGYSKSGISGDKTQAIQGDNDYWIVKLAPDATTGINELTTSFNLSISPNPSQGKFQLQLNNLTAKTAAITVSDLVGRIVYQQEIPVTGNQIQQEINLPEIKGMYMLQVKAGEQTSTRKIVIE